MTSRRMASSCPMNDGDDGDGDHRYCRCYCCSVVQGEKRERCEKGDITRGRDVTVFSRKNWRTWISLADLVTEIYCP